MGRIYIHKTKRKPVRQYSLDGEFIKEFPSMKDAAAVMMCNPTTITSCCKRKSKTAMGYIWRFPFDDEIADGGVESLGLNKPKQRKKSNKEKNVSSSPISADKRRIKAPVEQYSLEGELLATFESISEAARVVHCTDVCINQCLHGKSKTAAGFMWKYANRNTSLTSNDAEVKVRHKIVKQFDLDGNFIKEYPSVSAASKETGVDKSSIYNCCSNRIKKAGGFVWRYKGEETLTKSTKPGRVDHSRRISQFTKDGKFVAEYASFSDASFKSGVRLNGISNVCRGRAQTCGGFVWRYSDELEGNQCTSVKQDNYGSGRYYSREKEIERWRAQEQEEQKKQVEADSKVQKLAELKKSDEDKRKDAIAELKSGLREGAEYWVPVSVHNITLPSGRMKYTVSNFGNVNAFDYDRIRNVRLKSRINGRGYSVVDLVDSNGSIHTMRVDVLVATAFIENPEGYVEVVHKDGNKKNNNYNNLEWYADSED